VFWDIIWTVIDDINIALQSKKMSLVWTMKLLECLKSTLIALRPNFFHGSVSESLSLVSGLSIYTKFSSRQSKRRKI
jgi:hypothetical protein